MNACAPAGAENAAAIAEIMGQAAPTGERQVAFVRCNGGVNAKKRYEYVGVKDCISATKVAGGPLECAVRLPGLWLLRERLPVRRHVHRPEWHRRSGPRQVHRLYGLHQGLSPAPD